MTATALDRPEPVSGAPATVLRALLLALLGAATTWAAQGLPLERQTGRGEPARTPQVEGAYLSAAQIRSRREYELERNIRFPVLVRGNPRLREIALTFDDGPHGAVTEQYLDVLKQEKVPATFFLVGRMVDRYPEIVQRMVAEGHEVANHTYDHLRLPTLTIDRAEWELREGARAIERAVGSPTRLFRPPGGEYGENTIALTKRLGYVMVLWTDDPADYVNPAPGAIEARVMRSLTNGGILLLHDGVPNTLETLPRLIRAIRARGFKFVTCSQMARQTGVIIRGGPHVNPFWRPRADLVGRPRLAGSQAASPRAPASRAARASAPRPAR